MTDERGTFDPAISLKAKKYISVVKGALPLLGGRKASSEREKAGLRDLYKQTSLVLY